MGTHKFDKVEFDAKETAKATAKTAAKKSANVKDIADRVDRIEDILNLK